MKDILKGAVKILGASGNYELENDVRLALANIGFVRTAQKGWSTKGKKAADSLLKVLVKLRLVLNGPDLFPLLRSEACGYPSQETLENWIEHAKAIAQGLKDDRDPGESRQRPGAIKECAAEWAYKLMKKYDRKIVTTKKSEFQRLATILYGDPKANLNEQCLEVMKNPPTDDIDSAPVPPDDLLPNRANYAVATMPATLITGTGAVLQGEATTLAGDDNEYVVATLKSGRK